MRTLLACIFSALLIIAQFTACKLVNIFGIILPAGFVAYALTFLITDIVNEVYGKEFAKEVVTYGLIINVMFYCYVFFVNELPIAPFMKDLEKFFERIFSMNLSIVMSSIIAYIISQFHDVEMYNKLRIMTKGKFLFIRNNVSTVISQLIDTSIFITLAFYIFPKIIYEIEILNIYQTGILIINHWILKVMIALLDTFIIYPVVNCLKKRCQDISQFHV